MGERKLYAQTNRAVYIPAMPEPFSTHRTEHVGTTRSQHDTQHTEYPHKSDGLITHIQRTHILYSWSWDFFLCFAVSFFFISFSSQLAWVVAVRCFRVYAVCFRFRLAVLFCIDCCTEWWTVICEAAFVFFLWLVVRWFCTMLMPLMTYGSWRCGYNLVCQAAKRNFVFRWQIGALYHRHMPWILLNVTVTHTLYIFYVLSLSGWWRLCLFGRN